MSSRIGLTEDLVAQKLLLPKFFGSLVIDKVLDPTFDSSGDSVPVPMLTEAHILDSYASQDLEVRSLQGKCLSQGGIFGEASRLGKVWEENEVHLDSMEIDSGSMAEAESAKPRPTLVTEDRFERYYQDECASRSREERVLRILIPEGEARKYLTPGDFQPMLCALLRCHTGLSVLCATPDSRLWYSQTVIARIFFACARSHTGRLTLQDIKKSKLLDTLMMVDEDEDINRERKYFSFEHFQVLYRRFVDLDTDHDFRLQREDLVKYAGWSLSRCIVERVIRGYGRGLHSADRNYRSNHHNSMSYSEFVWFCLAEEDKSSETAVDYWFRCVDLDGDGLITLYDMEYFFREQNDRFVQCLEQKPVDMRDMLCELMDMVKPNSKPPQISRRDLKACGLASKFFNTLFNSVKAFEADANQREDAAERRERRQIPEWTDWDWFVARESNTCSTERDGDIEDVTMDNDHS